MRNTPALTKLVNLLANSGSMLPVSTYNRCRRLARIAAANLNAAAGQRVFDEQSVWACALSAAGHL